MTTGILFEIAQSLKESVHVGFGITGLVAAPAGKVANVINAFSKSN